MSKIKLKQSTSKKPKGWKQMDAHLLNRSNVWKNRTEAWRNLSVIIIVILSILAWAGMIPNKNNLKPVLKQLEEFGSNEELKTAQRIDV